MAYFSSIILPRRAGLLLTLALLTTAGASWAQTPASFGPISTYSTGTSSYPQGVAVVDINGDGRPDLVTANTGSSTVSVLLGQAGGGFTAASAYSTGANSHPTGVAVADVNSDGRLDVVTVNNASTLAVLLGQASGGFTAASSYSTGGTNPHGVTVADLNGDGRPDLLTGNFSENTIGVLLGQAGGIFAPAITYSAGAGGGPTDVAVADVNGDGQPDIVSCNSRSIVAVLLGQTAGGFASAIAYSSSGASGTVTGVAVADLNGDGRLDIVTANYSTDAAGVLLGLAGGGFAVVNTYPTYLPGNASAPWAVAIGDVNGDNRPDIVTANYYGSTAGVLLGQASGAFATPNTFSAGTSSRPLDVVVVDVNGDGRPDLVTANGSGDTVGVLLNTGTYTPLATATSTAAAEVILFPNPAHGGFTVQLPAAWGAGPVQATLLNALGQAVRQQTAALPAGAPLAFATEGLAPGVFSLRVQAGGHMLTKRIVLD